MKDKIVFSGHQPNFIPYMGWFYKVFQSDVFVLDDDVQYTSNDWTNKNFVKIAGQRTRITIPISYDFGDPINAVRIHYDERWARKLLMSLEMNYHKAPFFSTGMELIERHIMTHNLFLCDLNMALIRDIIDGFGFKAKIVIASQDVPTDLTGNARNIYQCERLGGKVYYSGTGGKVYNDEEEYARRGIELIYSDYTPVEYRQQGREFIPNLSVLDYIFNCGYQIPEGWKQLET